MRLHEYPVWKEGLTPPAGDPAALPDAAEVVVIGAGISGLAAARELARRGKQVVVLEAHTLGWGASSRNGGMVLTGLKLGVEKLIKRYGKAMSQRMFIASLHAIDTVERIVADEQIDCSFQRSGHLVVASKAAHYPGLATEVDLLHHEFGHSTQLIPREQLHSEIGSTQFYGGMVDPASASINPALYTAGLTRAAQRAGARLFDHTPVRRITRQGRSWQVETQRGTVCSEQVLVATGGYTGKATPIIRRRVVPIGSFIIATEPLTADLAQELSPHGRMIYDTRNFLYYFRVTPDQRMLFGGRASFFPETPKTVQSSADILRRAMIDVYPQLRDARITHAWGGNVDFTFDMMPHAGTRNGMSYAVGYAGHGVALATYLGTQMGAGLAGGTAENPFDQPLPRAPLGLYDGRPWFLPFAGIWYKLLDWIS